MSDLGDFIDDYIQDSLSDLNISKETQEVIDELRSCLLISEKTKELSWSFYKFSSNYIHSSSKSWNEESGACPDWKERMLEKYPGNVEQIDDVYSRVKEISRYLEFCKNDPGDTNLIAIVKNYVSELSKIILYPLFEGEEMYLRWKDSKQDASTWIVENRGMVTSKRFGF